MKNLLLIFCLLIITQLVNAQFVNELDVNKNLKISLVPHYLIFNGLRLDFEKKTSDNKAIVFAPQIYLRERKVEDQSKIENGNYFKSVYGAGFDIYRKHILTPEMLNHFYFAYGLNYNYFYINCHDNSWVKHIENNLEVYHNELIEINEQIHRFGGNLILGIDTDISDTFYFDLYFGLGLKYSYSISKDGIISTKFDNFMTNYGYTGTVFISGLKIGIKI